MYTNAGISHVLECLFTEFDGQPGSVAAVFNCKIANDLLVLRRNLVPCIAAHDKRGYELDMARLGDVLDHFIELCAPDGGWLGLGCIDCAKLQC